MNDKCLWRYRDNKENNIEDIVLNIDEKKEETLVFKDIK